MPSDHRLQPKPGGGGGRLDRPMITDRLPGGVRQASNPLSDTPHHVNFTRIPEAGSEPEPCEYHYLARRIEQHVDGLTPSVVRRDAMDPAVMTMVRVLADGLVDNRRPTALAWTLVTRHVREGILAEITFSAWRKLARRAYRSALSVQWHRWGTRPRTEREVHPRFSRVGQHSGHDRHLRTEPSQPIARICQHSIPLIRRSALTTRSGATEVWSAQQGATVGSAPESKLGVQLAGAISK